MRKLTFVLFIFTSLNLFSQSNQIKYSPEIYNSLKTQATTMNLQSILLKQTDDKNLVNSVTSELPKMLSLSPVSLASKMNAVHQCLVNNGSIKSSEAKLLNNLFQSYASKNYKKSKLALKTLMTSKGNSDVIQSIIDQLEKSGIDKEALSTGGDFVTIGWFSNLLTGIGIAIGGAIGAVLGGPVGAIIGAAAGGFIGRGLGELISGHSGFMAGPNGEDCTPPFLEF